MNIDGFYIADFRFAYTEQEELLTSRMGGVSARTRILSYMTPPPAGLN